MDTFTKSMNRSSILDAIMILYCWAYILYARTLSLFLRYCGCCNRSISCGCAYKGSQLFTVLEKRFIRRTISVLDAITYQLELFSLHTGPSSFSSEASLGDSFAGAEAGTTSLELLTRGLSQALLMSLPYLLRPHFAFSHRCFLLCCSRSPHSQWNRLKKRSFSNTRVWSLSTSVPVVTSRVKSEESVNPRI